MKSILQFSPSVIQELETLVAEDNPILVSKKGEMYALTTLPIGAIRLKVPLEEYLAFIESLDDKERPPERFLVPYEGKGFQIIVNAAITKEGKEVLVAGLTAIIL